MLLGNYGSDSESDSEAPDQPKAQPQAGPSRPAGPTATATSTSKATGGIAKPKRKGPVKITLDLPQPGKATADGDGEEADAAAAGSDDEDRSSKKPRIGPKGKGSSALLGMLPPPKRKTPAAALSKGSSLAVNKSMAAKPPAPAGMPDLGDITAADDEDDDGGSRLGGLLPASVARNKAKSKAPEPSLDLFGLSEPAPAPSIPSTTTSRAKPPTISSAPLVPDFVPPEPTPNDPYPGYYQLPSGQWAAYEPEYYHSFFPDAAAGEKEGDGRVGRHWDEFNSKGADIIDINATAGLEEARKEQERQGLLKKQKIQGEEYEYKVIGQTKGLAAQRHQLTSLLSTAYTQREELEDRIAQNKKNMRMAGQKYGF